MLIIKSENECYLEFVRGFVTLCHSFTLSFIRSFFYSAIKHFDSLINVTSIIVDNSQSETI